MLSRVDAVIVKDSWNKLLAFDEMLIEMFFERLILDVPELAEQFSNTFFFFFFFFGTVTAYCCWRQSRAP